MKSKKVTAPTVEPPATLLPPRDPESLRWEMQAVQRAIAHRAFELFEKRGGEHGHDWEDWFRAESEFLRPVSVSMSESEDRLQLVRSESIRQAGDRVASFFLDQYDRLVSR